MDQAERSAVFPEKEEYQTEAQRSGFGLERRRKEAGEECPVGRSEEKRTLRDEGAGRVADADHRPERRGKGIEAPVMIWNTQIASILG